MSSNRKIYVHYVGKKGPEWTFKFQPAQLDEFRTVENLLDAFIGLYGEKHPKNVPLSLEGLNVLPPFHSRLNTSLKKILKRWDEEEQHIDITLQDREYSTQQDTNSVQGNMENNPTGSNVSMGHDNLVQVEITKGFRSAQSQFYNKKFRAARDIWDAILSIDPSNPMALNGRGAIEIVNCRPHEAETWFRKALKALGTHKSAFDLMEISVSIQLIHAVKDQGAWDDALSLWETAFNRFEQTSVKWKNKRCTKELEERGYVGPRSISKCYFLTMKAEILDVRGGAANNSLARSLVDEARKYTMSEDKQTHCTVYESDTMYCSVVLCSVFSKYKPQPACLEALLQVLAARPSYKKPQKLFTALLSSANCTYATPWNWSYVLCKSILQPCEASAPAFAFLATVLKDNGSLVLATEFLDIAIAHDRSNTSYLLQHIHLVELYLRYDRVKEYCVQALQELSKTDYEGTSPALLQRVSVLKDLVEISAGQDLSLPPTSMKWITSKDPCCTSFAEVTFDAACANSTTLESVLRNVNDLQRTKPSPSRLSDTDLDVLAICFAVVKTMFLAADRIEILPFIVALLEPVRREQQLHQTIVRNEHAYYSCIAQILTLGYHTPTLEDDVLPLKVPPAHLVSLAENANVVLVQDRHHQLEDSTHTTPIYVCGDSHTLCTAWRTFTIRGSQYMFVPVLCTGLKHWHLRPEGEFYPKQQCVRSLSEVPMGSMVIFLIGEIDCREGILRAVERCRYESLAEGIDHTVDIGLRFIEQVVHERQFKAFLHPIVPVLNETRHIVKQYNANLHKKALQLHTSGHTSIKWLDFFNSLLTEDRKELRHDFEFDGTHLHPRYLAVLTQALEQHLAQA